MWDCSQWKATTSEQEKRKERGGSTGSRMLNLFVILWTLAGLGGYVVGKQAPSLKSCELAAAGMEPGDLVVQALGGKQSCADDGYEEACCTQIERLFGKGGPLEYCLCNGKFYSAMLLGLPAANGVVPESYVDMLQKCQIPVTGTSMCHGGQGATGSDPLVQSAILGTLLLSRALSRGATSPSAPVTTSVPPSAPTQDLTSSGTTQAVTVTSKAITETPLIVTVPAPTVLIMPPSVQLMQPQSPTTPAPVEPKHSGDSGTSEESQPGDGMPDISIQSPSDRKEGAEISSEDTTEQSNGSSTSGESSRNPVETPQGGCTSAIDFMKSNQDLSTFVKLLEESGLGDAFGSGFKGTVFAPTNGAFAVLLEELKVSLDALIDAGSREVVGWLVKLHIIADVVVKSKDLAEGQVIDTLLGGGESLTFGVDGGFKVAGAGSASPAIVTIADIDACQAVVHVIDKVLIPSSRVGAFSGVSG